MCFKETFTTHTADAGTAYPSSSPSISLTMTTSLVSGDPKLELFYLNRPSFLKKLMPYQERINFLEQVGYC